MTAQSWNYVDPLAADAFRHMDNIRHAQGRLLDLAGFGPKERPFRLIHCEAGLKLRKYGQASNGGPVVLIVPAPIKKSYIWDLAPEVSVVHRCLAAGMQVYLAEWTPVDGREHHFGLDDYGNRLLTACQQAIESDSGAEQLVLVGHSLGGVLAATFACLHPEWVRALVLLEAPLHFAEDAGSFAPLVAAAPDAWPIGQVFGDVPGSFLNLVSLVAAPHAFQWERYLDGVLSMSSPAALENHLRVVRWTQDEFPLPGRLFSEIVEWLYRQDRFMKRTLAVGDRKIGPRDLHAPLLNVIDPRSTIIPPQSILPFHEAAASQTKDVLWYGGDIGVAVQHVGVLVGSNAHANIWPAIFAWLAKVRGEK
jgi:polyhydroxyalkanoate synthase subunit PhaC